MISFIKTQPRIVERLVSHISSSTIADLVLRLIQCEESSKGRGIVEWLCDEGLVPRLVSLLSPRYSLDTHSAVSEFLRTVIGFSSNANANALEVDAAIAPNGAAGTPSGKPAQEYDRAPGFASNRILRELASEDMLSKTLGFVLDGCGGDSSVAPSTSTSPLTPSPETRTSSLVNGISVLVDLIRKNNSDFSEQQVLGYFRKWVLERERQEAFGVKSNEAPDAGPTVIQLGHVLVVVSDRLAEFQSLLRRPRSSVRRFVFESGLFRPGWRLMRELVDRTSSDESRPCCASYTRAFSHLRAIC
jgi:hypothetical protein